MQNINKKLCLCGSKGIEIRERLIAIIKLGEVLLIKVKYCGICKSDLKMRGSEEKINIRLSLPFKGIVGSDVLNINTTGEVSLKKVIEILVLKYPQFKKFVPEKLTDEKISKSFIVVRKKQIVLLNEKIREKDELKIFPTLAGG
mgnify:CR=1 FL=1